MYSPEEIEKKRRLAQQRRAQLHQSKKQNSPATQLNNSNSLGGKRRCEPSPLSPRQPKQLKQVDSIQSANFFRTARMKIACRMITESRFEVEAAYHQQLIDFLKTIPSKAYDVKRKLWNFHINDYLKLINEVKSQFGGKLDVSEIPQCVLQIFKNNLMKKQQHRDRDLSKIDTVLVSKLMPFQHEGICYAIEKKGRCMIADEMGLGKTIQALGVADYYKESWPLLIVTPSSVRYQWSEAIFQFLPSVPCQHVFHYTSGKDYIGNEKITIVSYDLLSRNIQSFEKKTFGFIIFDESHTLKSHKTERTKAAQRIASTARHILLLTGTPALSRPIELYSQISLINRHFLKLQDYGLRYCEGKKGAFGWDFQGISNTEELQLLLKISCLIRRLKSEVLTQLPDKIRQIVMLDPEMIKAGTKEMQIMADNLKQASLKGFEKHSELLKYYSESSKQRLTAVANHVKDLIEKREKFIIFAHHQCVLDKISEVLHKHSVKFIRIDGKTTPGDRQMRINRFQETEDCLVAVLSITAANSGITLTAASFVVFAELYWNPAELTQAEGRAHRIGQRNCVIIQYLIAKGTVDDILWPLLQSKAHFLQKAGLDQNFSLSQADMYHQPRDDSYITEDDKKQSTLDNFGFSEEISSNLDTLSHASRGKISPSEGIAESTILFINSSKHNSTPSSSIKQTSEASTSHADDDFAQLLEDNVEDFENIDLDNIS